MRVRFAIRGELAFLDAATRERAAARFLAATDGVVDARAVTSEGERMVLDVASRAPAVLFTAAVSDLEVLARGAVSGAVRAARDGDDAIVSIEAGGARDVVRDAEKRDALLTSRVRSQP